MQASVERIFNLKSSFFIFNSEICILQSTITNPPWLFLGCFFARARRSVTDFFAVRFRFCGPPRSFGPFPLLITAVMKLLIGCLFLHASIMS
jgi:hypothetical protein